MIIKIIFDLPPEYISNKHIEFVEIALSSKWTNVSSISSDIAETILPRLIQSKEKNLLLNLLRVIIKPKKIKQNTFLQKEALIDEYWLSEAIAHHAKEIIEICGLDVAQVVISQIQAILDEDDQQFSIAAVTTIEEDPRQSIDGYENQLICLLRSTFEQTDPALQKDMLGKLISSKHSIFRRLGIHVIGFHYSAFGHSFWTWAK